MTESTRHYLDQLLSLSDAAAAQGFDDFFLNVVSQSLLLSIAARMYQRYGRRSTSHPETGRYIHIDERCQAVINTPELGLATIPGKVLATVQYGDMTVVESMDFEALKVHLGLVKMEGDIAQVLAAKKVDVSISQIANVFAHLHDHHLDRLVQTNAAIAEEESFIEKSAAAHHDGFCKQIKSAERLEMSTYRFCFEDGSDPQVVTLSSRYDQTSLPGLALAYDSDARSYIVYDYQKLN